MNRLSPRVRPAHLLVIVVDVVVAVIVGVVVVVCDQRLVLLVDGVVRS